MIIRAQPAEHLLENTGAVEEDSEPIRKNGKRMTSTAGASGLTISLLDLQEILMKSLAAIAFALFAMPLSAQEVVLNQCVYEDKLYSSGAILILEDGTKLICRYGAIWMER